jgi:hypothetical protein
LIMVRLQVMVDRSNVLRSISFQSIRATLTCGLKEP